MQIAIYSRKSKQTDQGDSIANQIAMCKDYAAANFGPCNFFVYEDEGFSGSNTDRPMFKQLIRDIADKKFDVLICYRLDRISRNVANFAETLAILDKSNVGFVSVKEQFNTTTPMGKAMMYISSVFAQLERDTIAERISDSLAAMAKTGRYLGALPPQGYKKEIRAGLDGKRFNVLAPNEAEVGRVILFFEKYLELQSINKLEAYCRLNGLKTRSGKDYKCITIRRILTHPVYAAADSHMYGYFATLRAQIYDAPEKWDGTKGVLVYRAAKHPNPQDWLVGVGEHKPIISSAKWILVQGIIKKRRSQTTRRPIGKWGILSGLLRCENCGDYMRPFSRSSKTTHFYYVCATKEASRRVLCDTKNLRGDILDRDIFQKLAEILENSSAILAVLTAKKAILLQSGRKQEEEGRLLAEIKKNEGAIKNLVMRLAEAESATPALSKYITEQIEELDRRNIFLRQKGLELKNSDDLHESESLNFEPDFNARKNALRAVVENIKWDGKRVLICFKHEKGRM